MNTRAGNQHENVCMAKEGLLSKYRNFLMGWGTRYIKLDRSYLHNFDAKDAPNPNASLVRGEITRCSINHSFKGAAGPFVFDVVCRNGTTWYLRATTWEEMADWMLAIFPQSRHELDRMREGTSTGNLIPASLPPPIVPQNSYNQGTNVPQQSGAVVCEGDPPPKNPNMRPNGEGGESSGNGNNTNAFPPSYSDLFDSYDPAVKR